MVERELGRGRRSATMWVFRDKIRSNNKKAMNLQIKPNLRFWLKSTQIYIQCQTAKHDNFF